MGAKSGKVFVDLNFIHRHKKSKDLKKIFEGICKDIERYLTFKDLGTSISF